jgi:phosphatidylserine decarboxylase
VDPLSFALWRGYYFFRDPRRRPPPGRVVVSPADGRVLYVKDVASGRVPMPTKRGVEIGLEEWGGLGERGPGTLIGIYMTPFSVHFNRAPIAGRVTRVQPRAAVGENRSMARAFTRLMLGVAPFEKDSDYVTENARNTVVIDGEVTVTLVQIADRYVREVDCFVREGDRVSIGDKVGMIRMGSQCDLFLPAGAGLELNCKPGDSVKAGESVLARFGRRE